MILDNYSNLNIFQFGCGGTGSYLVSPLVKFLNNINDRNRTLDINYYLIDDDTVEQRNIIRQNFYEDDIGRNKATVKQREYCHLFENITTINHCINTKNKIEKFIGSDPTYTRKYKYRYIYSSGLNIIFGCTDNNKSRRIIFNYIKKNSGHDYIYIDSGNNLNNGQITTIIFNEYLKHLLNSIRFENINFQKMFPLKVKEEVNESCAFFGDQSQSINMMAANLQFINFQKIIVENKMPPNLINFNASGYSSFEI